MMFCSVLQPTLSVYILFELCWLVTGTVWVVGAESDNCDRTIYIFSVVVIVNFWIHILTPLAFMLCLCCFRVGVCSCSLWTFFNNIIQAWTSNVRWAGKLNSLSLKDKRIFSGLK